jgi:hypothetical protein
MNASSMTQPRSSGIYTRTVVAITGLFYALAGLALLLAPAWFFNNVGAFPPFNRHYAGDLGTFLLPLGIGLLVAARDPARHRTLIGVITAASVLHFFNHLYDDLALGDMVHLVRDSAPLLILALLLLAAFYGLLKERR